MRERVVVPRRTGVHARERERNVTTQRIGHLPSNIRHAGLDEAVADFSGNE